MNDLNIYLDSCEFYSVATEAFTLDKLKSIAAGIITRIKEFIQRLGNWISSKFMKLFHMETVTIDQKYYNEMMRVINKVKTVDLRNIETVLMNVNTVLNNEDNVKKYGNIIENKLKDLDLIAENAMTLKPNKENKQLTFSTSILKSMRSEFEDTKSKAYKKMALVGKLEHDPQDLDNLHYTHTQIILIGRLAAIDFKKCNICIDLLEKLMSNCAVASKEEKEEEVVDEMPKEKKENVKFLTSKESFIEEIAMESIRDSKTIFRKNMKDIRDKVTEFHQMPEKTVEDCDAKLKKCDELISLSYNACQELRKVKPDNLDKFVSGVSYIISNTVDLAADTNVRSTAYGLSPQSPDLARSVQTICAMTGLKWVARAIGKGTIRERMSKVNDLLNKMIDKNKEFNQEYTRIRKLKNDISEREKTSSVETNKESKSLENFIDFCDDMMIAEEGIIRRTFAKSENDKKAKTVLGAWGSNRYLPTEDEARAMIKRLESTDKIYSYSLEHSLVKCLAVLNYPQQKFVKLAKKFQNLDIPKYMIASYEKTEVEVPELTAKVANMFKLLPEKDTFGKCAMDLIRSEQKKYGTLKVNVTNGKVYKIEYKDSISDKVAKIWAKGDFRIVDEDGGGNYLLYSISNGKFYDYFHEQDTGADIHWLQSGIAYKDLMKNIMKPTEK